MQEYIGMKNLRTQQYKSYGFNQISYLVSKGFPYSFGWGENLEGKDAIFFAFPHTQEVREAMLLFKQNEELYHFAKSCAHVKAIFRDEWAKKK